MLRSDLQMDCIEERGNRCNSIYHHGWLQLEFRRIESMFSRLGIYGTQLRPLNFGIAHRHKFCICMWLLAPILEISQLHRLHKELWNSVHTCQCRTFDMQWIQRIDQLARCTCRCRSFDTMIAQHAHCICRCCSFDIMTVQLARCICRRCSFDR